MAFSYGRRFLALAAASSLLIAASPASAEVSRPAFSAGEVAVEGLVGVRSAGLGYLNVLNTATSGGMGLAASPSVYSLVGFTTRKIELPPTGTHTMAFHSVWAAPSLDVFVTNRVSVGMTAAFARGWGEEKQAPNSVAGQLEADAYTLAIAPRVGYVIPLEAGFSLWPRAGVGFTYSYAGTGDMTSKGLTATMVESGGFRIAGGVDLGLVYRPTRRFFFSATPELSVVYGLNAQRVNGELSGVVRGTTVNFAATLDLGVVLGVD